MKKIIIYITALFLIFQVGHFYEHLAQVLAWITSVRSNIYMSSWAIWLVEWLGEAFFPNEVPAVRNYYGVEILHLIGNTIFLFGIVGLMYYDRSKKTIWGFITQLIHVIEHVALTITAIIFNKSIGISTLFGVNVPVEFLLAYRIWVHFILNLIPSVLIFLVVYNTVKPLLKHVNASSRS